MKTSGAEAWITVYNVKRTLKCTEKEAQKWLDEHVGELEKAMYDGGYRYININRKS